jgi:16S rRNA (uracil1498-N3)-methyltransferase
MLLPLFYSSVVLQKDALLALDPEEASHAVRVLRMKTGDQLLLTDGKGARGVAEIVFAGKHDCAVKVVEFELVPHRPYRIHLAIAPTKSIDRFEWFLEKATELGVDEITPLFCEHSERRNIKNERLQKILLSAMKQSEQSWLPVLQEACDYNAFINRQITGEKYIAWCGTGKEEHLVNHYQPGRDALVMIGPEGDFSGPEVEKAVAMGYIPVSLGPNRLRTETAGLAACSILNLKNEIVG